MVLRTCAYFLSLLAIFAGEIHGHDNGFNLPCFHVTPAPDSKAWLGDPMPFFCKGVYHVFQQIGRHPDSRGNRWRHLTSNDLVDWRDLGDAWQPTAGYPEYGRVFTGSIFHHGKQFHALYTNDARRLIHAVSADLVRWERDTDFPTNDLPVPSPYLFYWNDPHVFQVEGEYRMVVGTYLPEKATWAHVGTPCFVELRSPDLRNWQVVRELVRGTDAYPLFTSECPDYFALGDRQVLIASANLPVAKPDGTHCFTYAYVARDGGDFVPEDRAVVDTGGIVYAAKTLVDNQDRRILFGWIMDLPNPEKTSEHSAEHGWSGVLSLPRVMSLGKDGSLRWNPPRELRAMRDKHWSYPADQFKVLGTVDSAILSEPRGDALEIVARFQPAATGEQDPFGIVVRASADGSAGTWITVNRAANTLTIRNKGNVEPKDQSVTADLPSLADRDLLLHVFLDRSVIEVFADERQCFTARAYVRRRGLDGVGLVTPSAAAGVDIWTLKPANIERPR